MWRGDQAETADEKAEREAEEEKIRNHVSLDDYLASKQPLRLAVANLRISKVVKKEEKNDEQVEVAKRANERDLDELGWWGATVAIDKGGKRKHAHNADDLAPGEVCVEPCHQSSDLPLPPLMASGGSKTHHLIAPLPPKCPSSTRQHSLLALLTSTPPAGDLPCACYPHRARQVADSS